MQAFGGGDEAATADDLDEGAGKFDIHAEVSSEGGSTYRGTLARVRDGSPERSMMVRSQSLCINFYELKIHYY
ncbi:hypothetical protein D3C81_1689990 [compost metagenome]